MKANNFLLSIIVIACIGQARAQGVWIQKNAMYAGCYTQSNAYCVIGSKAYIGMATNFCLDWWEYNPVSDSYLQKASFPDTATGGPAVFSISGYCYVLSDNNRLWKYDPVNDSWSNTTADFPGTARYASYYFTIGTKGYLGGGVSFISPTELQDFWEYNSISNQWSPLANLSMANAMGEAFSINGKGYITGGIVPTGGSSFTMKVYEYDPNTLLWSPKNDFPDGRFAASSFVIGNDAYVGMGIVSDANANTLPFYSVYKYDNLNDLWLQMADIPFNGIYDEGVGFVINNKGYMGFGDCNDGTLCSPGYQPYIFEYTPENSGIFDEDASVDFLLYPNPTAEVFTVAGATGEIQVYNIFGHLVLRTNIAQIDMSGYAKGVYFVRVEEVVRKVVLH